MAMIEVSFLLVWLPCLYWTNGVSFFCGSEIDGAHFATICAQYIARLQRILEFSFLGIKVYLYHIINQNRDFFWR